MNETLASETVDYIAIRRLQSAYADIVTRRAFDELGEIFRPDTTVTLDIRSGDPLVMNGPGEVGQFIGSSLARFGLFEFVVLNTVIEIGADGDPDRARARMYMWEIRSDVDSGRRTDAFGVYHDDHVRVDGRWWFAARRYHSMARTGPDAESFGFPADLDGFVSARR